MNSASFFSICDVLLLQKQDPCFFLFVLPFLKQDFHFSRLLSCFSERRTYTSNQKMLLLEKQHNQRFHPKTFLKIYSIALAASLAVALSWSYFGLSSTTSRLINFLLLAISSKTLKAI